MFQKSVLKSIKQDERNLKILTFKLNKQINQTYIEIDKIGYELYGPSDEEIKIVEIIDE